MQLNHKTLATPGLSHCSWVSGQVRPLELGVWLAGEMPQAGTEGVLGDFLQGLVGTPVPLIDSHLPQTTPTLPNLVC